MKTLIDILVILAGSVVVINLLLLIFWQFRKKYFVLNQEKWPKISVLLAVRDEEQNLSRCLDSLVIQKYPKDKLEILIGDDQSIDKTYDIAKSYEQKYDQVRVFKIENNLGTARGKANVIAQLAHKAKGDVFMITDADMHLPKVWARNMLKGLLHEKVGIVNGFTIVEGNNFQNVDWIFALGMVKVIADRAEPVTGMGNNMLITRAAYESVGGYESLPFSVTEDFELFKAVTKKGFRTIQMADYKALGITRPLPTIKKLLHQRKRWMKGAIGLKWPIIGLLLLQALYFPAIIALAIFSPLSALFILLAKIITQTAFIKLIARHLRLRLSVLKIIGFEVYSAGLTMASCIFYLLPVRIEWKRRKY